MVAVTNTPAAWSARAAAPSSHECAGWSERGQTLRFLAVLEHLQLRVGDSLLDFGCGTGRLCEFLPHDVTYTGYDTAPGMLDRARHDHATSVFVSEIPPVLFDHVVAVGPFNLPGSDAFEAVSELWHESVRRSLVVSLYRGTDDRCVAYSPDAVADWARRIDARRFVVDGSYLDNDLIFGAYK